MAMNINNLKIFINAADAGNLTRAAEALYISQPAVSKAIKNIEDDLGVALFYRDKKTAFPSQILECAFLDMQGK